MQPVEEPTRMRDQTVPPIALVSLVILAPLAGAEDGVVPRKPRGKPDLSGTYDIANLTPFERDPKYGDEKVMPPQDAEAIAKRMAGFRDLLGKTSDPNPGA